MANKMKIFQTLKKNFATAGISPKLSVQSYPLNGKILIGFLILHLALIFCFAFTFYEAKTFAEYTQSTYMGAAAALLISCLLIIILTVKKLFENINGLENIVNTTLKYSSSKSIFNEALNFEHKSSELIFLVMVKMTPFALPLIFIYNFLIYFTTNLGPNAFHLPSPMWFPFDWKNPFGYFLAITIQFVMVSYGLNIGACLLSLAVGSYLYAIAASKCIKDILIAISRSSQRKSEREYIWEQLIEFIKFHSRFKQHANDFSDIIENFITALFLWSLVTICGALLMIQMELLHHSDNLAMLLVTIIQISYAFGIFFFDCELGQRINLAFEECNDMIDQFDWYLFPPKIQRLLPILINFAREPVVIKCFGSAACDRETFKYVIKTAFSYFTVLRKFYK